MAKGKFLIQGKIVDKKTKKGMPGLKIEAWDKDLVIDNLLGSTKTDENGRFTLSFDETLFFRERKCL